jgi:hypothetical protein
MVTSYVLVTYDYNFRALYKCDRGFESSLVHTLYVHVLIRCVPLRCVNARPSIEPY